MPSSEIIASLAIIAVVKAIKDCMNKEFLTLIIVLASCLIGVGISFLDPNDLATKAEILRGLLWGLSGSGIVTIAKTFNPQKKQ